MRHTKPLRIGKQETRHTFDIYLHLLSIVHQFELIVALEHPPELLHLDLHAVLHVLPQRARRKLKLPLVVTLQTGLMVLLLIAGHPLAERAGNLLLRR